ncbi:MAG: RagB/SusD family nutrient uptake outer membrane protein [[Clostridium] fimetarium]|nr:RagB/SusD family nutrient uptake outer membrane protein [Alistipes timonensis]MCM1405307.1 RagB/SusD family nutrient uptake outer membrane protein [[Clostridium] fimetarium]
MNRYISAIALGTALLFSSCDDFLQKEPDFLSPDNYYNTPEQVESALNGVYNRLIDPNGRMYSKALFSYFAISDEAFYKNISINNIRVMQFDAGSLDIGRFWEVLYEGVSRANYLIARTDESALDTPAEKAMMGEARFLRGYYYFLLTSYFGEVPLKLTPTLSPNEKPVGKAPLRDIYAQIEKDMLAAEELCLDIDALGTNERVSVTAVQAVLARVYLKMAGYPLNDQSRYADALTYAEKVVSSNKHALNRDYQQIFINHSQDINDPKECVWEVGMYGNKIGSVDLAGSVGVENGILCRDINVGYSGGAMQVTKRLYDAFEEGDLRRDWCIAPYCYETNSETKVTTRKYFTQKQIYNRNPGKWRREYETGEKAQSYNSTNFPIMRYSDVLLMKAEAINAVKHGPDEDAYEAINQVRRRAWGLDPAVASEECDLKGLGEQEFLEAVQKERFRELCFEGQRKLDLIRWGIYVSTMNDYGREAAADGGSFSYAGNSGNNITDRNVVFPIPNTELTVNKLMTQNPGW